MPRGIPFLLAALLAVAAQAAPRWCLGLGSLGPLRTGMSVEQVLPLADWPGLERRQPAGDCWYMRYEADGADFDLMIIRDQVVRIELGKDSRLHTLGGARIGVTLGRGHHLGDGDADIDHQRRCLQRIGDGVQPDDMGAGEFAQRQRGIQRGAVRLQSEQRHQQMSISHDASSPSEAHIATIPQFRA